MNISLTNFFYGTCKHLKILYTQKLILAGPFLQSRGNKKEGVGTYGVIRLDQIKMSK